jgi:crotonobetainyl-CoA:carnitine CoA-transferase CaiB-like acyl-CoA transferase
LQNFDIYYEIVREWARETTVEEASAVFDRHDIPYARVNDTGEVINSPVVQYRNMLPPVDLPGVGRTQVVNTPFKFSGSSSGPQGPPPLLGEHSGYVYGELLGLADDEIEDLTRQGIIAKAEIPY